MSPMVPSLVSAVLRQSAFRGVAKSRPTAMFAALTQQQARAFSSRKYAPTHEWVRADDGTMGISDFAQGALGEVVFCDLPSAGDTFKGKETICTLESVKAVGEVYAPADCEVVEVNEKLNDEPALVNSSPFEEGWLVKLKFTANLDHLMDQGAYDKHLESESKEE